MHTWLALVVLAVSGGSASKQAEVIRLHRAADASLVAGEVSKAREGFAAALELAPEQPTLLYGLACAEARAGERELALATLNRAAERGYCDAALAEWDADLASLRGDPCWPASLRAAKLSVMTARAESFRKIYDATNEWNICAAAVDRTGILAALAVNRVDHEEGTVELLDARTGKSLRRIGSFASQVRALAFDPSGTRLGLLTNDGRFWFAPIDASSAPRAVGRLDGESGCDRYSYGALVLPAPDGQHWFVAVSGIGALLCDAHGARVPFWQTSSSDQVRAVADWSPDGKLLAWAPFGQVRFFDAETGKESDRMIATDSWVIRVSFHPDGRSVATGDADGHACVWDLETYAPVLDEKFDDPGGYPVSINDVRFSPDGRRLGYSTASGVYVIVLDLATKQRIFDSDSIGGRMGETVELTWSGDSHRLWYSFVSNVMPLEGAELDPHPRVLWTPIDSGPLRVGNSGVGVSVHDDGVIGVDTSTGFVLWRRAAPGRVAELVQTPEGYLMSDSDDFATYRIRLDNDREVRPRQLTEHALELFDPKRVRARAAGIELVVPKL